MASVTVCSDFGAHENKVCYCFYFFPIYFPWSDGTGWWDISFWTVAHQALLSMGFSRQEYWSRLPCPPPGALPDPGIKPASLCLLHWEAHSWPLVPPGKLLTCAILISVSLFGIYYLELFCKEELTLLFQIFILNYLYQYELMGIHFIPWILIYSTFGTFVVLTVPAVYWKVDFCVLSTCPILFWALPYLEYYKIR